MDGGGEGGRKRKGGKEKKDERDGGREGRGGMGSEGKEDHKIGWVLPCLCVKTSSNIHWVVGGGGRDKIPVYKEYLHNLRIPLHDKLLP